MFRVLEGDVFERIREIPDESVDCCITSPPYWGLRDYGTARWIGGLPDCDHLMLRGSQGKTGERAGRTHTQRVPYKTVCGRCGASRFDKQIGLERSISEFIETMVAVFREVRRVLKASGTLWVNLGDSYNNREGQRQHGQDRDDLVGWKQSTNQGSNRIGFRHDKSLKVKDLVGMPWRVALALQSDGWYLRSDIIYAKNAPMPESVKDRPTRSHEYIFLLSKQERYFYDADAIKEKASTDTHARYARGRSDTHKYADGGPGNQTIARSFEHMAANVPAGWHQGSNPKTPKGTRDKQAAMGRRHAGFNDRWNANVAGVNPKAETSAPGSKQNASFSAAVKDVVDFRNKRSVWTISSMPTPEKHFATYPIEIPETCLLAGSPPGGTILDPFSGAGTTGLACLKHGRNYIGIELNEEYVKMSYDRARRIYPLLVSEDEVTA